MPRRSRGKLPRVPAAPDILYPKPVGQEGRHVDDDEALEIIMGEKRPSIKAPRAIQDLGICDILQEGTELCAPRWSKDDGIMLMPQTRRCKTTTLYYKR